MSRHTVEMWQERDGVYYRLLADEKPFGWGPYKSEAQVKQSIRRRFNRLHEVCDFVWIDRPHTP